MATNTLQPGDAPAKRDIASIAQDIQLHCGRLSALIWAIDENIPDNPDGCKMNALERAVSLCALADQIAKEVAVMAEDLERGEV